MTAKQSSLSTVDRNIANGRMREAKAKLKVGKLTYDSDDATFAKVNAFFNDVQAADNAIKGVLGGKSSGLRMAVMI